MIDMALSDSDSDDHSDSCSDSDVASDVQPPQALLSNPDPSHKLLINRYDSLDDLLNDLYEYSAAANVADYTRHTVSQGRQPYYHTLIRLNAINPAESIVIGRRKTG